MTNPEIAIYTGATSFKTLMKQSTVDLLWETPVTQIILNVEKSTGGWRFTYGQLRELQEAYRKFDRSVVCWPHPGVDGDGFYGNRLHNMEDSFVGDHSDWRQIVYDIEGQANTPRKLDQLAEGFFNQSALHESANESWLTTHTGHHESSKKAIFRGLKLEVQALSTASAVRKYGKVCRPGNLQRFAFKRIRQARPDLGTDRFGFTLPLYGQKSLPGGPRKTLPLAFNTAADFNPERISFWSLRHLLKHDYARKFMTETLPQLLADRAALGCSDQTTVG